MGTVGTCIEVLCIYTVIRVNGTSREDVMKLNPFMTFVVIYVTKRMDCTWSKESKLTTVYRSKNAKRK